MQKLCPSWAFFARMQRTTDHHQIDNRYWAADDAADAALALITAAPPAPLPDIAAKIQVMLGNRTAKHRRRAISHADHMRTHGAPIIVSGPDLLIEARAELAHIHSTVSASDWQILEMTGMGESHAEIAAEIGLAEGTVKNRLSQLRKRLFN